MQSRDVVSRKFWSKNVSLERKQKKKPGKRNSNVLNGVNEEGRPRALEVDVRETIVPESEDSQTRIGNQKSETLRQHQSQNSGGTELRI